MSHNSDEVSFLSDSNSLSDDPPSVIYSGPSHVTFSNEPIIDQTIAYSKLEFKNDDDDDEKCKEPEMTDSLDQPQHLNFEQEPTPSLPLPHDQINDNSDHHSARPVVPALVNVDPIIDHPAHADPPIPQLRPFSRKGYEIDCTAAFPCCVINVWESPELAYDPNTPIETRTKANRMPRVRFLLTFICVLFTFNGFFGIGKDNVSPNNLTSNPTVFDPSKYLDVAKLVDFSIYDSDSFTYVIHPQCSKAVPMQSLSFAMCQPSPFFIDGCAYEDRVTFFSLNFRFFLFIFAFVWLMFIRCPISPSLFSAHADLTPYTQWKAALYNFGLLLLFTSGASFATIEPIDTCLPLSVDGVTGDSQMLRWTNMHKGCYIPISDSIQMEEAKEITKYCSGTSIDAYQDEFLNTMTTPVTSVLHVRLHGGNGVIDANTRINKMTTISGLIVCLLTLVQGILLCIRQRCEIKLLQ